MPTSDQANSVAQRLISDALQQQHSLSSGFLQSQIDNPTSTYPKRPWIDEPDGSVPFDPQNGLTLGAVGGSQIVLTLLVPIGMDGVIKGISHNTVFPFSDFSGDLQWQLLQNGRAIRNFDNMLAQKGTIAVTRPISPLRIYSGDTITYVVNHLANAGLNGQVVCSVTGYFYPLQGLS
jgi:hypothetical protein